MGLDSVEIVISWERAFGVEISDDEACHLTTPRTAIDLIATKLGVCNQPSRPCLSMRAFHRIRRGLVEAGGVPRSDAKLQAKVRALLPRDRMKERWNSIRNVCGLPDMPGLGWIPAFSSHQRVADFVQWAVASCPRSLKPRHESWSRPEIRTVVRAVVTESVGISDEAFSDDDEFVRDMGID
jgi:hypothetical protein